MADFQSDPGFDLDFARLPGLVVAALCVIGGLLLLIDGLAAGGSFSGGWWKGPIVSLGGLGYLAWRWQARG